MAKVNARFVTAKATLKAKEVERDRALFEKGQEQIRSAAAYEREERRLAEERF